MFDIAPFEIPEPDYLDAWAFNGPKTTRIITKYERKLGRKVKLNEGLDLLVQHFAPDPQATLPRFFRCAECGDWVDRGAMAVRHQWPGDLCDYCQIPF